MSQLSLETIVSLCKRRGFIYQGSEIYGGLAGTWDYGPLGAQLKRNIVNEWLKYFVDDWDDMYLIDTAILMNPKVWEASGHIETFTDPMIEDVETKKRYRLDHLLEDAGVKDVSSMTIEEMHNTIKAKKLKSPDGNELGNPARFNLMFKSSIGSTEGGDSEVYLRPETAQGMFVNFRNIVDSFYPDLPFGLAQVGRNFRNEISPRDFIFRSREFEIMEFEWFINPKDWEKNFEKWQKDMRAWFKHIGLPETKVHEIEVPATDRAHYSKKSVDTEFDFPFGTKEIAGLAYRTDFDLSSHQKHSGKNMEYRPKDGSKPFIPHVIEPTFGVDRHVMAVLCNAYTEDEINGEKRAYLKLPANLAPVKVAVLPLVKNKPELTKKAQEIYKSLKKEIGNVMWVDSGNIGKNYRRMDEIGVPYCVTIDFETMEGSKEDPKLKDTVTVRYRDTTEQHRYKAEEVVKSLK